jgi:hypothetical protein
MNRCRKRKRETCEGKQGKDKYNVALSVNVSATERTRVRKYVTQDRQVKVTRDSKNASTLFSLPALTSSPLLCILELILNRRLLSSCSACKRDL